MKKIISLILSVVMAFSLFGCGAKQEETTPTYSGPLDDTRANYVEQWTEVAEDGSKTYYTSIVLYSSFMHDDHTTDDILFLNDNSEYIPLEKSDDGIEVKIFQMNQDKEKIGTCTFVLVKSTKLIDWKRVYYNFDGYTKYEDGVDSLESYIEKHGNRDAWYSTLVPIGNSALPHQIHVYDMTTTTDTGIVYATGSNKTGILYYDNTNHDATIEGNSKTVDINVTALNEDAINVLLEAIQTTTDPAILKDNQITPVELDERLQIVGKQKDADTITVGFELKDGSDFNTFDGIIPEYLIFYNMSSTEGNQTSFHI